jgi:hypothetical protein
VCYRGSLATVKRKLEQSVLCEQIHKKQIDLMPSLDQKGIPPRSPKQGQGAASH